MVFEFTKPSLDKETKMNRRFLTLLFIVIIIGLLIYVQLGYAQEQEEEEVKGIELGPVKVHPSIKIEEQYDDNIFLDPGNEKDDFITTVTPGLGLELPFSDNIFKLDYKASIVTFADYHSSQDSINHYLNGKLELNFRDFGLTFEDKFEDKFARPDTELTPRISIEKNTAKANAAVELNRLGFELGYSNILYNYKSSGYENEDRDENVFTLIGSYRFLPKTSVLLEFDYGKVDYDTEVNSDADYYQAMLGLRGKLTAKSVAEIKVGYQNRDYEKSGESDFDSVVTAASIVEEFTPFDTLRLDFLRNPYESQYKVNNYYTLSSVSAAYTHKFTKKFSGNLSTSYQLNDYPRQTTEGSETKKRNDDFWSLGGGIDYEIQRWLSCGLKYEYKQRESNFDTFDYKNNLVTLTASITY